MSEDIRLDIKFPWRTNKQSKICSAREVSSKWGFIFKWVKI